MMVDTLRRRVLAKSLWKKRIIASNAKHDPEGFYQQQKLQPQHLKPGFSYLLKRMSCDQMSSLLKVIDNCLDDRCVVISAQCKAEDALFVCRLWRWPQLGSELESSLRTTPECALDKDHHRHHDHVCINPFHYSTCIDDSWSEDGASQISNFCETFYKIDHIVDVSNVESVAWCRLVYREYREHVGRLLPILTLTTRIFGNSRDGLNGLCLSFVQPSTRDKILDKTRRHIGKGIIISREGQCTWLFNCSSHPVFVSSPVFGLMFRQRTISGQGSNGDYRPRHWPSKTTYRTTAEQESCRKVPSGCCLRIFDRSIANQLMLLDEAEDRHLSRLSSSELKSEINSENNLSRQKKFQPNSESHSAQPNCKSQHKSRSDPCPGAQLGLHNGVRPSIGLDLRQSDSAPQRPWGRIDGPRCYNSVHVSFGKGWGVGYSRKSVIYCPCWMEILFS